MIRAVSSCWISGKNSAETVLSPNDVLCLPALGHARGAEIRKEEESISLIPGNSLEENFRGFLLLLGCTFQPGVFFCCEGTKLLFNNGGGSVFLLLQGSCSKSCYLAQRAILLTRDSFHVLGKFHLYVTKLCCCKDTFGSRSLHCYSIDSREEKMSKSSHKVKQTQKKLHSLETSSVRIPC